MTGKVRLSYVHLFEPSAVNEGEEKKYSSTILIPKSDKATVAKINKAVEAAKVAGAAKWGGKVPANLKTPLRDGDAERPDSPEYAGHYFLNASSRNKPGVVDQNVQPILDSTEIYSGVYARVSLNFYPFAVSGNKGVAAGLNNVQKVADGDYLGGRSRAEDEFDALLADDDDLLN